MYGYYGKILTVNLTDQSLEITEFDETYARQWIGGNGFIAEIINRTVPADADAFAPENAVVFTTGPLNGSPLWGTGRGHLGGISPLTGYFADSNFGGDFAAALKRSGFDAVSVTGISDTPCYLFLDDGEAELRDAGPLMGLDIDAAHEAITGSDPKKVETALIGPAGENLVLFANIMCSGKRPSAAGRGGLGAVLGSKNFKGIAATGNQKPELADETSLKKIMKERIASLRDNAAVLTKTGTPVLVNMLNNRGTLATHNNTRETFGEAHAISGEVIEAEYKVRNSACYRCPVACGKDVAVPHGPLKNQEIKMPEYETIYALGSMLDNSDLVSIFNANGLCDRLGLDTITMGVTLSFVAECIEKNIISEKNIRGSVHFGSDNDLADLVIKTAHCKGIGEYLALGSVRLAESWGKGSEKYLYAVKGMEIAGHSARGLRPMSLAYATSTRGGSHHDGRPKYLVPDTDPGFIEQPWYICNSENFTALGDSLVTCRFITERGFGSQINAELTETINAVTGFNFSIDEYRKTGARIYTLERHINCRRGLTREEDTLPWRVMHKPIPDGPAKGRRCTDAQLNAMLNVYYELRGYDQEGVPTEKTLAELGIPVLEKVLS